MGRSLGRWRVRWREAHYKVRPGEADGNIFREWLSHLQRLLTPHWGCPEILPKPNGPGCELKFPRVAWIPFCFTLLSYFPLVSVVKLFCTKEKVLVPFLSLWWSCPTKAGLRGRVPVLACKSTLSAIIVGNSQQHDLETAGHRAERGKAWVPVTQLAFSTHTQSRAPKLRMVLPIFRPDLPTSIQTSKVIPPRHAHKTFLLGESLTEIPFPNYHGSQANLIGTVPHWDTFS